MPQGSLSSGSFVLMACEGVIIGSLEEDMAGEVHCSCRWRRYE